MKKDTNKKEYIIEYDMTFVNIFSLVLLLIMCVITFLLIKFKVCNLNREAVMDLFQGIEFIIFFIVMILWMVLHEIIHAIAYLIGGAKKEDVVFGAALEKGVFYCKAKNYINKKCIMLSLLSPLITIGVVTYIIGIILSNIWLVALSVINISGAAGDIMMFMFFLRQKEDVSFRELGFSSPAVVKTDEDISLNKYIGVKNIRLVTDQKEVTEGPEKKITISKPTWIFMIVMAIVLALNFILLNIEK